MTEVFGDLWSEARSDGRASTRVRFWLQTGLDVATSAAFEWVSAVGSAVGLRPSGSSGGGATPPGSGTELRGTELVAADVRDALRHFRRAPVAAAVMALVLSIGVGANSALFALGYSVRTQPPPGIPRDASLVRIRATAHAMQLSYPQYSDFAQLTQQFDAVAAWTDAPVVLAGGSGSESTNGRAIYVTEDYFAVLGARPRLGASLPSERVPNSSVPAVISDRLWRDRFQSSADVIGRTLRLNDEVVTVVGVAPPRFEGTGDLTGGEPAKVWLSLADRPRVQAGAGGLSDRDSTFFRAAGRLHAGVTAEDASEVVGEVAERSGMTRSRVRPDLLAADVVPMLADNYEPSPYRERQQLLQGAILSGLTLLILLVTCTNVSGLLVGSAMTRRREVAVRLALGASRGRLIRQLLTESVVLALAAGGVGLLLLAALIRFFGHYLIGIQVAVAWPTVAFTVGFAVLTGILFGMSPALHATRLSVGEVLKDSGAELSKSRMRLQRGLIVGQIALTQPLLVLVVAMGTLAFAGANRRAGSELADRIVTVGFRAQMPTSSFETTQANEARRQQEMARVRERLAAVPGVVGVVPYAGYGVALENFHIRPADRVPGGWAGGGLRLTGEIAAPGYLGVMGIPILAGRDFDASDPARDSASIIIGSDLAARLWGSSNPIGRRIELDDEVRAEDAKMGRVRMSEGSVIGVVDARVAGPSATDVGFRVFVGPRTRGAPSELRLRTVGPADGMAGELRAAALAASPDLPITSFRTLAFESDERRREMLLVGAGAAAGGVLALLLSAIGLFAVISLAVIARRREIGIRIALGAGKHEVVALFLWGALRLAAWGVLLGLPLSVIGLGATDFRTNMPQAQLSAIAGVVALGVVLVAAAATWIPARRAAGASPVTALRERADEGP